MLLRRDAVVHAEQARQSAPGGLGYLVTGLGKHCDTGLLFCGRKDREPGLKDFHRSVEQHIRRTTGKPLDQLDIRRRVLSEATVGRKAQDGGPLLFGDLALGPGDLDQWAPAAVRGRSPA